MANNNNMEAKKGTNFTELDDKTLATVTAGAAERDTDIEKMHKIIAENTPELSPEQLALMHGKPENTAETITDTNNAGIVSLQAELHKILK